MKKITIKYFQDNFEELMKKVNQGESFYITSQEGEYLILPYQNYKNIINETDLDDEIIKLHTDHSEGS